MLMDQVLARFLEKSPVPVMARALLERALSAGELDEMFERTATQQYTRSLLFSTCVNLLTLVVCRIRKSVNDAYKVTPEAMGVAIQSVYDKLKGIEPSVCREMVRHCARRLGEAIRQMRGEREPLLAGYRVKMLDGNCLGSSEHRILETRTISSGPLPGKSLVVYDPQLSLAIDVVPCEDGHSQERSLLSQLLDTIEANDVWVADRNFCTFDFLYQINKRDAFFIIRHHKGMVYDETGPWQQVGPIETGYVFERTVVVRSDDGRKLEMRLLRIQLHNDTRDGDSEIYVLTNLPVDVNACRIAEIYRDRWMIETAFQTLTQALRCEIETLGYPKAALFGFCVALACYNVQQSIRAALRSVWGEEKIDAELSDYYVAHDIDAISAGMMVVLPDEDWKKFGYMPAEEFAAFLQQAAGNVDLVRYKKSTRGPKKPKAPRTKSDQPHVSTKRLLDARKQTSSSKPSTEDP